MIDRINETKQMISLLIASAHKRDHGGIESTLLTDIKPSSFEFVMNEVLSLLNEKRREQSNV